jgi:hypothetical protein
MALNSRPEDNCEWLKGSTHYECVVEIGNHTKIFYYSQGPAVKRIPKERNVLCSLFQDGEAYDSCSNVDEFLENLGYTSSLKDIRRGERVWRACKEVSEWFKASLKNEYESVRSQYQDEGGS